MTDRHEPDSPAAAMTRAPARPTPRYGRPRICILTETYHPVVGGGERQAQMLAADLAARGLDVLILTRRTDRRLAPMEVVDGVPVHRIPPAGMGQSKRWLMVLSSARALWSIRGRYDIILVSGFKALGVSAVPIGKLLRKPCILKADSNGEMSGEFFAGGLKTLSMTPASPPFRAFLALRNAILRRADAFVAITAGIADELERHGVASRVIRRVSNGVDTDRFRPVTEAEKRALRTRLGVPDKEILITYTGRLVTYKGLPVLVRVAERLRERHPEVGFVLIGSGGLDMHNCEATLKEYVADHRLGASVHFAGEVSNVHEFLQASDIFVLPTEDDAFPLALVEAMACGLPVVTTPVGGIPEIVTGGENGLLVPPGDVQRLHDSLCDLIEDPARAAALGESGVRTVRERYSREIVADRYVELFRSALR